MPTTKSQQVHSAPADRKDKSMNSELVLISSDRVSHGRRERLLYVRRVGRASQGPIIRLATVGDSSPVPQRPDSAIDPTGTAS